MTHLYDNLPLLMRSILALALLVLTTTCCFANEIDKLQSLKEVTTFLRTHTDKYWQQEVFFDSTVIDTSRYGKNRFFKLDLDANGLTDLVVNGKYLFAVTDEGNGNYSRHFIDRGAFTSRKYNLLTILPKGSIPLLVVKGYNRYRRDGQDTAKPDTLLLKFGAFIEYQSAPSKLQINQVSFSTSGCYGSCPIFELTIQPDRTATYHAIEYNKKRGKFKAVIDTAAYDRLVATLEYVHFFTLRDFYQVNWTDDQSVDLEVKLSNGQVKHIHDYGAIGTFGLANLYAQLFKLRESQGWK
jgi:hypothetical protein